MARSSSTGHSTHNMRVKEEKIKVKTERNKGKQRAIIEEELQQHEEIGDIPEEEADEDEVESGSPRGAKRTRINGEGDSAPSQSRSQHPKIKTQPRDTDGYLPGSIVRIQLSNFVTYDYVQFRPGPYLNMIIGPNGTGKSSIACAIALGLNFPPNILGRANEINSYVKNGTKNGYIEIELKGRKNHENIVIRRHLNAASKTSTFTLNGATASGTEINSQMAKLNVQVGNLCSFLPQDRVTEFAAMSPKQLLKETQKAAGDENLTAWHETLISAGKEQKDLQQKIKDDEDQLRQMKERNEGIERDVQRYKERKRIEHLIALLDVLIPVAEYREIRTRYKEIKIRQRTLRAKVIKLKEWNAPVLNRLKKYEQDFKDVDNQRDSLKKSTQAKFKKLGAKNKSNEDLEEESSEIIDKFASLKREDDTRKKNIAALKTDIDAMENEIAKPRNLNLPSDGDLKAETEQLRAEKPTLAQRKGDLNYQMEMLIHKRAGFQHGLQNAQSDLSKQDDNDVQKLNMMARWDKDTHDAILWVRKNRHLFRMEVFETPFMRLRVKDQRYTNAIEACFGQSQMKTFVTQCQEDCDVINRHIIDTQGLGRKARITTWFRPQQDNLFVAPPMSREELQQHRFDGYALDYIDYPQGMEWFLMRDINLHRTAVALNGSAIDVNQAMQLVARPLHNHPGGATFITGNTINIVSRSRYGKKAVSNMTRDVQKARNLSVPTADPEIKRMIEERLHEAQRNLSMCDEERVPIKRGLDQVELEEKALQARYDALNAKKAAVMKERTRESQLKAKLEQKKKAKASLEAKPGAAAQRPKLMKRLKDINETRMRNAKEYTDLVHAIISEQQECTRVALKYLQVSANKNALEELWKRKNAKYEAAGAELKQVTDEYARVKADTSEVLKRSRDALENASPEVTEEYSNMEEVRVAWERECKVRAEAGQSPPPDPAIDMRSADELQAELETQRANLEMNLNTNPGVVEQYEKRKRDIEQLEVSLESRRKKEEKVAKDIKNARDNWQPALQRLVDSIGRKFSAAFDRIGCAGEIRINENEDYDKWAIDILVKFRSTEKLQLLTAHRQSGGERSLTTIMYLLSLTEEARAPFSLVDEINQGMDARAERMVHNSMVGVTCKEESGQYFLITPKLLPDLKYDEKMKVLVINNGEWLPEEKDIGCMNDMIDVYLQSRAQGMGAM